MESNQSQGGKSPHVLLHEELTGARVQPAAMMQWMIHAYRYTRLAHAMAALGIADQLRDAPTSTSELATRTGVTEKGLGRLLRGLAWIGALTRIGVDRWELTPLGRCLQQDADGSLHDDALHAGNLLYPAWGALTKGLVEDRVPFELAFDRAFFEELGRDPRASGRFDRVMNRVARSTADALAKEVELEGARLLVDVGGGNGETLARLLRAAPDAKGIVFDHARSESAALANLAQHGCLARAEFIAGDFFEAVAQGGDVYVLQRILHDWSDADCERILVRVAQAMKPTGRVLVMEELLSPNAPAPRDHVIGIDLAMMVVTGGAERDEEHYRKIAENSGLRLISSRPTPHGVWILELGQ